MQFKVPQNIDMEDKIVGPLTLIAFTELMVTLMIGYSSYRYGGIVAFVILGVPIIILGLAFAFVRPNEQPFSRFALAIIQFFTRPKLRVWQKDPALERLAVPAIVNPLHQAQQQASLAQQVARREQTVSQLDQLARVLDTQGEAAVQAAGGVTAGSIAGEIDRSTPKTVAVTSNKKVE